MKKVLLTGASGFIGRQAIPYLEKDGYEIHCVASRQAPDNSGNVIWHKADLLNEHECQDLLRKVRPTHLLHFAWYAEPGRFWTSEKNLAWRKASMDLLDNFGRQGGEHATLAGTCAEYDWNAGICREDVTPLDPQTLYGICKNQLREEAELFCSKNSIVFSWGRIFFLYGPYEHPSRLVSSIILSLLKGAEIKCTEGSQVRDYLYSEDVASAFVRLLDCGARGTFNIGSGTPVSIKKIIDRISLKIGRPGLAKLGAIPMRSGEPPVIVADTGKISRVVNWKPAYSLDQGLDKTIEWWKQTLM